MVSGKMVFNPECASVIAAKDMLIVLGQPASISKLESLASRNISQEQTQYYLTEEKHNGGDQNRCGFL